MASSSGLSLATIYNQSQLAERKHVARYWSINTAVTAVPLSAHSSPLVITTKLAAAILGGRLFGGGVLPAQYCPCDCNPRPAVVAPFVLSSLGPNLYCACARTAVSQLPVKILTPPLDSTARISYIVGIF